ncbi:hypothetical protein ACFPK5_01135 [Streptomyces beijiangensis]|uniref:hypothetical protein n=1 Tax=Streptomyces beijiangensis TaxID=163361 RepID=UPI0036224B0D
MQWGSPGWGTARILPVRIDLARSANPDFETVVLTVRLALAEIGRPLPAFDLALRRYWEHQHPGDPLEDYLNRGGLAARSARHCRSRCSPRSPTSPRPCCCPARWAPPSAR